jgi:hypothetical protein
MTGSSHLKHDEHSIITIKISTVRKKDITVETIEAVSSDSTKPKAVLGLQAPIVDICLHRGWIVVDERLCAEGIVCL